MQHPHPQSLGRPHSSQLCPPAHPAVNEQESAQEQLQAATAWDSCELWTQTSCGQRHAQHLMQFV
jgi:hypothetical protein